VRSVGSRLGRHSSTVRFVGRFSLIPVCGRFSSSLGLVCRPHLLGGVTASDLNQAGRTLPGRHPQVFARVRKIAALRSNVVRPLVSGDDPECVVRDRALEPQGLLGRGRHPSLDRAPLVRMTGMALG
jgi:hypothetical protein